MIQLKEPGVKLTPRNTDATGLLKNISRFISCLQSCPH